jgi:hypothetical protein
MVIAAAALLLLVLLAAGVTVSDAVRSPHWRVVAVERRRSYYEQLGDEAADGQDAAEWVRASAQ